jgi:hypothetical protein
MAAAIRRHEDQDVPAGLMGLLEAGVLEEQVKLLKAQSRAYLFGRYFASAWKMFAFAQV